MQLTDSTAEFSAIEIKRQEQREQSLFKTI